MSVVANIRRFSWIVGLAACAAALDAARAQLPSTARSRPTPHKDPALATVFGVLVPGGGQLYAERYGKGGALLGGSAAAIGLALDADHIACGGAKSCNHDALKAGGIVVTALLWGYGWVTAGRDARLYNAQMLNTSSIAPFLDRREGRFLAGVTLTTR